MHRQRTLSTQHCWICDCCEKVLAYYSRQPKSVDALRRRFPQRGLERITERASLSKAYWDRTIGSLQYCSGGDAEKLERKLKEERAEISANLTTVRARLARTVDESQELRTVREGSRKRFSSIAEKIATALMALRLVHHLFEADSPPHRPIPCSDPVAKHYRWWLSMLILLSLIALPGPWLLSVAGLAPALQVVFLETYKACFLALLLLFLLRKERVLGLGDVRRRHWGMMIAWIVYPLAAVCVASLLLLQLVGFGSLVTAPGPGYCWRLGSFSSWALPRSIWPTSLTGAGIRQ